VLLLAFGGLLTLMIAAGVSALFSLRRLHVFEQQVSNRFAALRSLSVSMPGIRRSMASA
jgi:hypothetical protein